MARNVFAAGRAGGSATPAPTAAAARPTLGDPSAASGRRVPVWVLLAVPALAELLIGGYQLGRPSLWRDEAYTIDAASRPAGAIIRMLRNVDAVHGLYYLMMHVVVGWLGSAPAAIRLPSLIAMVLAAAATAVLGRRLARTAGLPAPGVTGITAGVIFAALPLTTWYAQDARPYGPVVLFTVLASYLLLRAVAGNGPRWWLAYGLALLVTGLFSAFALLIAGAHFATMLTVRNRSRWLRWLAAVVIAFAVLSPLFYFAYRQGRTFGWVGQPGIGAVKNLVVGFAGSRPLVAVVGVLAICGIIGGWRSLPARTAPPGAAAAGQASPEPGATTVTLPWLVLPPGFLLAVSQIHPAYVQRYVVFCLPALALLCATGLSWLARLTARLAPGLPGTSPALTWLPSVAVLAVFAVLLIGPQRAVRLPSSRSDNLIEVSAILRANEHPGDAVLYLPPKLRATSYAYPAAWSRLDDIALARSPAAAADLSGRQVPKAVLRQRLAAASRVWLVARPSAVRSPRFRGYQRRMLAGMHLVRNWKVRSIVLRLYSRG
jgi:mannosyltransferase